VAATLASYGALAAKLRALGTPAAVLVEVPTLTHALVGLGPSSSSSSSGNDGFPAPAGWSPFSPRDVADALAAALVASRGGAFAKGVGPVVARLLQVRPLPARDRDACLATLAAAVGAAPEAAQVAGGLALLAQACGAAAELGGGTAGLFRAVLARLEFRNAEDDDARAFVAACAIPEQVGKESHPRRSGERSGTVFACSLLIPGRGMFRLVGLFVNAMTTFTPRVFSLFLPTFRLRKRTG
jgi:hypothetical protein